MISGNEMEPSSYQKTDQYGRPVGKILLDGSDINLEQVKAEAWRWHLQVLRKRADALKTAS